MKWCGLKKYEVDILNDLLIEQWLINQLCFDIMKTSEKN